MLLTDTAEFVALKLLRFLAFALTAAAMLLAGAGCGDEQGAVGRPVSFGTERTFLLKVGRTGSAKGSATPATEPLVAQTANAIEARRIVLRLFLGETEDSGLYRQTEVAVPPLAGTLILKGVRPGRKRVSIEVLTGAGARLFAGGQTVDFSPGSTRYVEFLLTATPPPSARDFRGGPIAVDTRLPLSQSPYLITTPIVVLAGATLTIEPGVELRFATPPTTEPDILVRGRVSIGDGSRVTSLVRQIGVSSGPRLRFEASMGNTVTNVLVTGTAGAAFELSSASASITSCSVSGASVACLALDSVPTLVGNRIAGGGVGFSLARSVALVDSNRFTDSTTAVLAIDSSVMALSNVIQSVTGLVTSGIRLERCTATLSQNRITGTTGVFSVPSGRLATGLDRGIEVIDSLSGSSATSQPMLLERNTVEGAVTAGLVIIGSDPLVRSNRIANGKGRLPMGSQGVTINRVLAFFPKQPQLLSNDIQGNNGPAVGFLLDPSLDPIGGGVLGGSTQNGNFVRANNQVSLGFEPGVDLTTDGSVDGFFTSRTLQLFGVDAILTASATVPAQSGAPAAVK